MTQAPQGKGPTPPLRTVMPDPLRKGARRVVGGWPSRDSQAPLSSCICTASAAISAMEAGLESRVQVTFPFRASVFSAVQWGRIIPPSYLRDPLGY